MIRDVAKATKADTIGIHVRNEIIDEIVSRANALGVKKGTYGAMILDWWHAQGCPAVSEPDRLMQIAAREKEPPLEFVAEDDPKPFGKSSRKKR